MQGHNSHSTINKLKKCCARLEKGRGRREKRRKGGREGGSGEGERKGGREGVGREREREGERGGGRKGERGGERKGERGEGGRERERASFISIKSPQCE